MPLAVSTCGAKTTAGFLSAMAAAPPARAAAALRARAGGGRPRDRRRCPGRGGPGALGPRLEHGGGRGDVPHLEDLRPAIAEPAVADHQPVSAPGDTAPPRGH